MWTVSWYWYWLLLLLLLLVKVLVLAAWHPARGAFARARAAAHIQLAPLITYLRLSPTQTYNENNTQT